MYPVAHRLPFIWPPVGYVATCMQKDRGLSCQRTESAHGCPVTDLSCWTWLLLGQLRVWGGGRCWEKQLCFLQGFLGLWLQPAVSD